MTQNSKIGIIPNLTNGTKYTFQILAVNGAVQIDIPIGGHIPLTLSYTLTIQRIGEVKERKFKH